MKRYLQLLVVLALTIIIVSATLTVFLNFNFAGQKAESGTQRYLSYRGEQSRIYLVDATSSYNNANETYVTPYGQVVQQGSPLLVITATMRNDYSPEMPPPPNGLPISPADGTAYVYFTAILYNKDGAVNASNLTIPDFWLPSTPGTALVLASGQTAQTNIYLSTDQRDVTQYVVELIFLGDSIPTT
jgi:hypothetical protein